MSQPNCLQETTTHKMNNLFLEPTRTNSKCWTQLHCLHVQTSSATIAIQLCPTLLNTGGCMLIMATTADDVKPNYTYDWLRVPYVVGLCSTYRRYCDFPHLFSFPAQGTLSSTCSLRCISPDCTTAESSDCSSSCASADVSRARNM